MPNVPVPKELREDVEVARELGGPKADPRMSPMAKVERRFICVRCSNWAATLGAMIDFGIRPGLNFARRYRCRERLTSREKLPFDCRPCLVV